MKKHIYLNLKRFDVAPSEGGVNRLSSSTDWATTIMNATKEGLASYSEKELECAIFWPELHVLGAAAARKEGHTAQVGCQSVAPFDIESGVNFGAMTTLRSAKAMAAAGCEYVIIGHCEERKALMNLLVSGLIASNPASAEELGVEARLSSAINNNLRNKVDAALNAGLKVLFCVGESAEQRNQFESVIKEQLSVVSDIDSEKLAIAYEPVWAIGPGKTPPGREDIQAVAQVIKAYLPEMALVYGGGLKQDNAAMLASIEEIDGGLIALTRFSGEIGFYPEEYLEIISLYMKGE